MLVIGGTLPSMLLCVRECVFLVGFRTCFAVGFGAAMIGGAFDIQVSGGI